MLTSIHPKLPMRNKATTRAFYVERLGFVELGDPGFDEYLMIAKDQIEIHFFLFRDLTPEENYGQVYVRTHQIENLYQDFLNRHMAIHPNGALAAKPWGQKEFSILDPDNNLLTFGESL